MGEVSDALELGIGGPELYDAWSGGGAWTPIVRLRGRDAQIVARWIEGRERQIRRDIAAEIRQAKPAPNSHLTWKSGRDAAARIARRHA